MLNTPFKQDVHKGLSSFPKFLYSKYIYDKKGDKLFQDIMAMPSYYLTGCEYNILSQHATTITNYFIDVDNGFDLIELGAGDGKKTKVLLNELVKKNSDFTYKPIDISQNAIDSLTENLKTEKPEVDVSGEKGEYFEVLKRLKKHTGRKKAIIVLGSNIGNLLHPQAINFLTQLQDAMAPEDMVLIGFDQKKNPQTILDAYNDPEGITEAFNKNLLVRINNELAANFDVEKFKHWEVYDPETGTAKSYLVAKEKQIVTIAALDLTVSFDQWETIHTEISQKYDDKTITWLAAESGLKIIDAFTDQKNYYKNYLFQKK